MGSGRYTGQAGPTVADYKPEPPDEPEELEEDDEEGGVVAPSDRAYENARDKRMEQ